VVHVLVKQFCPLCGTHWLYLKRVEQSEHTTYLVNVSFCKPSLEYSLYIVPGIISLVCDNRGTDFVKIDTNAPRKLSKQATALSEILNACIHDMMNSMNQRLSDSTSFVFAASL